MKSSGYGTTPQMHKHHCLSNQLMFVCSHAGRHKLLQLSVATGNCRWRSEIQAATHHFFAPVHCLKGLLRQGSTLAVVDRFWAFWTPQVWLKHGRALLVCAQLHLALGALGAAGVNLGLTPWARALGSGALAACGRLCRTAAHMSDNSIHKASLCSSDSRVLLCCLKSCLLTGCFLSGPYKLVLRLQSVLWLRGHKCRVSMPCSTT